MLGTGCDAGVTARCRLGKTGQASPLGVPRAAVHPHRASCHHPDGPALLSLWLTHRRAHPRAQAQKTNWDPAGCRGPSPGPSSWRSHLCGACVRAVEASPWPTGHRSPRTGSCTDEKPKDARAGPTADLQGRRARKGGRNGGSPPLWACPPAPVCALRAGEQTSGDPLRDR